jgi:crotonobetainyl-CoA:carnitine CoA-transferase CaiB-like acyl-CoA transferase
MTAPLTGIRVLDLSRVLAGPWATQMLADYGAEVIKIERPGRGDDTRHWGLPGREHVHGAGYFLATNRGKHSVAIDFAQPEGAALVQALACDSDIVVENFLPGDLARYGLDYGALSALNPRLIYCSITGFGQDGPLARRPGYDAAIQAMGGLMSVTGDADGAPQKAGIAVVDLMTGVYAVAAILAALHARTRDGVGQHLDLALFDTQVAMLSSLCSDYQLHGVVPKRHGSAHPNIVPYQAFDAADAPLYVAVGNDVQFRRLAAVLAIDSLADDARFATNSARVANRAALVPLLAARFATRSRDAWLAALAHADVPAAPVNDLAEVFAEPQLAARGLRFTLPRAAGDVPMIAHPARFSATPPVYAMPPPHLGEHTDAVLRDRAGADAAQLAAWRAAGVIA